jgi:hypothetical protein
MDRLLEKGRRTHSGSLSRSNDPTRPSSSRRPFWNLYFLLKTKQKKNNKKSYLDTVVTGDDASILHLDVGWRMSEFAFGIGSGALGALKFAADLQLEPARIFGIDHVIEIDVHHGHTTLTVTFLNQNNDYYTQLNDDESGR